LARQIPASASSQAGAALVTGLIFLVILTLLGITAMQTSTMEERMSGNARDRNIAFQAAEAALRDAERDIKCQKFDGSPAAATTLVRTNVGCISGMTGADANCTDGLCCVVKPPGLACVERTSVSPNKPVYIDFSLSAEPSVAYGTHTAAPAITSLNQQPPRYLIEPFLKQGANYYRITARGYGFNANTQVTLQEVYKE
jgi:type IV pilus assembly protein PilX